MESPVRIKSVAGAIILFLLIASNECFPRKSSHKEAVESTTQDPSAVNSKHTHHGARNNSLLYPKRNASTVFLHSSTRQISETTMRNSPVSGETTVGAGNKINFRGSMKYFATRPPFKPKSHSSKPPSTKFEEKPIPSKPTNEDKSKKIDGHTHIHKHASFRRKINYTENTADSTSDASYTVLPELQEESFSSTTQSPPTIVSRQNERVDSAKSLNYEFNIDRYTSPEFHDANNVYSQSISVPENVSDYFFSVGSAPYTQQYNNYYTPSVSILTTPRTDLFDKRFKEVSESIRQNLADSEFIQDEKTTTEKSINFEEFLEQPEKNDTKVFFENSKEITFTDTETSNSKHKDYTNTNGTKVFYEVSTESSESYDQKSSTLKILKKIDEEDATTLSSVASNEIFSNKQNNTSRRMDHLKINETRKEFLTTIRMRAHTTPRPRVRISLKTNRSDLPSTSTSHHHHHHHHRTSSTTRNPNLVKMFPHTRRRLHHHGTASSKIDPVYQDENSPTRTSAHVSTDSDNSIPTLRKRGSVKYYGTTRPQFNSSSENNEEEEPVGQYSTDSQLTIPPTATAWALISMKNTPMAKKNNDTESHLQNQNAVINKSDEELQILDKFTDGSNGSFEKVPTISTANENTSQIDYENDQEITSASRLGYTTIVRPSFNKTINDNRVISENNKSSFESITKLPDTVTRPPSEIQNSHHSIVHTSKENYSSEDEDYNILLTSTLMNQVNMNNSKSLEVHSRTTTTVKYEKIDLTTTSIPQVFTTSEKTTTPYDYEDEEFTTTTVSIKLPYDTTVTSSEFITSTLPTSTMKQSTTVKSEEDDFMELETTVTIKPTTTSIPTTIEVELPSTTYVSVGMITVPSREITSTSESPETTTMKEIEHAPTTVDYSNHSKYMTTTTEDISDVDLDSYSTEDSTPRRSSTESRSSSEDIEVASTVYYGGTNQKTEIVTMSSTTVEQTTPSTTTTTEKLIIETTLPSFNSEENIDSREAKKTSILDDEDDKPSISSNDNLDDILGLPDSTVDTRQLDSNEVNIKNSDNSEIEFTEMTVIETTSIKTNEPDTTMESNKQSNIEIIKSEISELKPEEQPRGTTSVFTEDIDDNYEGATEGSGAVAAITISVIGVVALLLLVILLIVARGRRRSGGYGQRCTPVSLDSYSLDNVSVSGSTRRKARRPSSKRSYGNPAYDESGATSHPMQFAALANFALNQDSIVSEFNEIPTITAKADEVPPGCELKNRYSNVIPLPETRVMLKPIPGDDTSDYINANYVRGPKGMKNYYIACQAPLASTVNDFWRMIWEQNSRVILMLTEFMENGAEKCHEYIPPSEVSDSRRIFGDFQVTVKKRDVRDKYVISILQLKNTSTKVWREITHMWYFWPAKGVPEESNSIITFLIEARSYLKASQSAKDYDEDGHDSMVIQNGSMMNHQPNMEQEEVSENDIRVYNVQKLKNGGNGTMNGTDTESRKKGGPMIVHCSPGTGRTGALIACDIGIRDFEMSRTVDVPKTVYRIRRDRANAVQTKDQYIFVYKVLSDYATKLTGGILD